MNILSKLERLEKKNYALLEGWKPYLILLTPCENGIQVNIKLWNGIAGSTVEVNNKEKASITKQFTSLKKARAFVDDYVIQYKDCNISVIEDNVPLMIEGGTK